MESGATNANNFGGGYELTATNAIMPGSRTGNLRIMPAQADMEPRSRGGGSTHENCDTDILRMERRLKDFESVIKTLNEKNDYTQGQVLLLLNELNKYKERDRHIEQVMIMALHLLVNLAGYSTFP